MSLIDTINPDSFYNSSWHVWFYLLLTAHLCVLIDISPWQKRPMCELNLLLASLAAAIVPCVRAEVIAFPSPLVELTVGMGTAVALSLLITLNIQRILDIDINY